MNTPIRLGAYAFGLVAVFAAAAGMGSVVGPVGAAADDTATHDTASSTGPHTHPSAPTASVAATAPTSPCS